MRTYPIGLTAAALAIVTLASIELHAANTNPPAFWVSTNPLVFGNSSQPQQSALSIGNPGSETANFIVAYQPVPVFGTALPSANIFFVSQTDTTITPVTGNTVGGTLKGGQEMAVFLNVNPAGLPTGIYSGQFVIGSPSPTPTQQTTAPLIVYIGPQNAEDLPSRNGLALMLPANSTPIGKTAPGTPPASPGAYALTLSVPGNIALSGPNSAPNPTLIEVASLGALSNLSAPVTDVPGVFISDVRAQPNISNPTACSGTFASSLFLGPPCVWELWVYAPSPSLITPQAGCPNNGRGVNGTITFAPASGASSFANLVVPLTLCFTDTPQLVLGIPTTYPTPTFGPALDQGFGNCFGRGGACNLAVPANLPSPFPMSVTESVIAQSGAGSGSATVTAVPISLVAEPGAGNSVCRILDIHSSGGDAVSNVTITQPGASFASIQPLTNVFGGALFLGPPAIEPNSLQFNLNRASFFVSDGGIFGWLANLPGVSPFAAGPNSVGPEMQTFAICGDVAQFGTNGPFTTTITITGDGVGAINIPVTLTNAQAPGNFGSEIAVFRPATSVGAAPGRFILDADGNYMFNQPADKSFLFGVAGDIPVAGDWDGSGVVRIGVYRPSNGHWYLDLNNNGMWDGTGPGSDLDIQFGSASATCVPGSAAGLAACQDIPIAGDWNGNGVTKLGIFRSGQFFLDNQNPTNPGPHTSFATRNFGTAGDLPVASNWTHAAAGASTCPTSPTGPVIKPCDQIGVYRRGVWFVNATGDGVFNPRDPVYTFGSAGDIPVVGTWTFSPNIRQIGVFSSQGQWFLDLNDDHTFTPNVDRTLGFGQPGDLPIVGGVWTLP